MVEALVDSGGSLGVGVKISWSLGEEVGTETLVGVEEDSVDVVVELGGNILGEELNLVDQITTLGSLGGGSLSRLSVVGLDGIVDGTWLNSGDIEAGSEGRG